MRERRARPRRGVPRLRGKIAAPEAKPLDGARRRGLLTDHGQNVSGQLWTLRPYEGAAQERATSPHAATALAKRREMRDRSRVTMNETRTETSTEEFFDETTHRRMRRTTVIHYSWADCISRYHGDPDGWSGWTEMQREVKVEPVEDGA